MRLHEEYIARHDLSVSVVRYDKRSTVFLKSKSKRMCEWRILAISWKECDWHPGCFDARYTHPRHDGYKDVLLRDVFSPRQLHWDEYEDYLVKFVEEMREEYTAVPSEDKYFVAWQFFLVMYDSALSVLGPDFIYIAGKSLAPDVSLKKRNNLVEEGKSYLKLCSPNMYDALIQQVVPLTTHYAEWLVKLINEE